LHLIAVIAAFETVINNAIAAASHLTRVGACVGRQLIAVVADLEARLTLLNVLTNHAVSTRSDSTTV
jgi:hypothetical protein